MVDFGAYDQFPGLMTNLKCDCSLNRRVFFS
jgi:hypothetical protein